MFHKLCIYHKSSAHTHIVVNTGTYQKLLRSHCWIAGCQLCSPLHRSKLHSEWRPLRRSLSCCCELRARRPIIWTREGQGRPLNCTWSWQRCHSSLHWYSHDEQWRLCSLVGLHHMWIHRENHDYLLVQEFRTIAYTTDTMIARYTSRALEINPRTSPRYIMWGITDEVINSIPVQLGSEQLRAGSGEAWVEPKHAFNLDSRDGQFAASYTF